MNKEKCSGCGYGPALHFMDRCPQSFDGERPVSWSKTSTFKAEQVVGANLRLNKIAKIIDRANDNNRARLTADEVDQVYKLAKGG